MKYIKLFETYEAKLKLEQLLDLYRIENYIINLDGTIDVNDKVNLNGLELNKIPFRFGKVTGYFGCRGNNLNSLEGCPIYVGEDFDCSNNNLINLVGSPEEVNGNFYCMDNKLNSLTGIALEIKGDLGCENNELTELDCVSNIEGNIFCDSNKIINNQFNGYVGGKIYYEHGPWPYSDVINENLTLTYESIVGGYCNEVSEFTDYKSKFIITKLLEHQLLLNRDTKKASLETLHIYAPKIFTNEGINKIRDYKNSEWIKALDTKLTTWEISYPNVVSSILKEKKQYKAKQMESLITTNIRIYKMVLEKLNKLLPSDIRFNFQFKGLVEVTDKNFLKLILFYKEELFSLKDIEEYKNIIGRFLNYSQMTENGFVEYLKNKGIESKKAELKDDVKGIDVIDQNGITYQVKAPSNITEYKTGYFIPKSSQLDIRKLMDVDRLVLYINKGYHVLDTKEIKIEERPDGIFIKKLA